MIDKNNMNDITHADLPDSSIEDYNRLNSAQASLLKEISIFVDTVLNNTDIHEEVPYGYKVEQSLIDDIKKPKKFKKLKYQIPPAVKKSEQPTESIDMVLKDLQNLYAKCSNSPLSQTAHQQDDPLYDRDCE